MKTIHLKTTTSTNDYAKEYLEQLPDKTLITADFQTAGKGRFSRRWHSEKNKNFLATLLLKKPITYTKALIIATLSVVDTLLKYKVKGYIKLPNDIYVHDKKIAGILIEMNQPTTYCLMGIGINLNDVMDEFKNQATSLKEHKGSSVDIKVFEKRFIEILKYHLKEDYKDQFHRFKQVVLSKDPIVLLENKYYPLQDMDASFQCKVNERWLPCQYLEFVINEKHNNYK